MTEVVLIRHGESIDNVNGVWSGKSNCHLTEKGMLSAQKLGKKFHTCKLGFDITLVLLSVAASFLGLKRLVGVREGTVIAAVFLGPIIGICMRLFGARLRRFCLGAKTQM